VGIFALFTAAGALGGSLDFELERILQRVSPEEEVSSVPMSFSLYQNYPNPFNPTTEIEYFLPCDRHVKLEIFNMLGEKVATLEDRRQTAGYKSVRWNSGEFATGIYFYKLTAGDFTGVKMMTLLR